MADVAYSSVMIGPDAQGEVSLFIDPQRSPVRCLGKCPPELFMTHTAFTTSVVAAGEINAPIGDFSLETLRLDFIGADLEDVQWLLASARYRLVISRRLSRDGRLCDLPLFFDAPLQIEASDTFVMKIGLDKPLARIKKPILVRVVLTGVRSYRKE